MMNLSMQEKENLIEKESNDAQQQRSQALSTSSQQDQPCEDITESTALVEDEKDIAGEMPNEMKNKGENVDRKLKKYASKSPNDSPKSKPNKKGLKLQLNVEAANKQNMHRYSERTDLLTPASKGTPKPMNVAVFTKDGEGHLLLLERGKVTTVGEIKMMMLEVLAIPKTSSHLFSIWFISPHLELQLKDHHIPFLLRKQWSELLKEFALCKDEDDRLSDEPVLVFQRNSFLSTNEEEKVTNQNVIQRLFEEARHNVLNARYPVPIPDAEILGGMLARVKLGPYDPEKHKPGFFKKMLSDFLPYYAIGSNKLVQMIRQSSSEQRLIQQYERATKKSADTFACQSEFLNYCRSLPFYGCAFFKGSAIQDGVEIKPWKSCEKQVTVGINRLGITLFHANKSEILIHLPYDDLSWEFIREDEDDDIFCIEYDTISSDGETAPEQVQIVSKQACMMDAMVSSCINFMNTMNIPKTPTSADYKKILDISYSTIPSKKHNFSLSRPFKH